MVLGGGITFLQSGGMGSSRNPAGFNDARIFYRVPWTLLLFIVRFLRMRTLQPPR